MALQDPVAVYNAATNIEAQFVCNLLNEAGVEAYVTEDISQVGWSWWGLISEIHKPQVWTDQINIERARPVLQDYERKVAEKRNTDLMSETSLETAVEAVCEECGKPSEFPPQQRGSVQSCPHCGAFMDVGSLDEPDLGFEGETKEPADE